MPDLCLTIGDAYLPLKYRSWPPSVSDGPYPRPSRQEAEEFGAVRRARGPTGEPVLPLEMFRNKLNIDHEEASVKCRQEMLNASPALAEPSGPQGGSGEDQGGPKPPSDGNRAPE